MNTITISLVGGPPWGFRIAQEDNEPPFVSLVLPEGRAYNEGMRVGDYIDGVNGEDCAFADQVHQKMRSTKGVLRLRLKRLTNATRPQLPILPKLKITTDENCSTPDSSAPPTPSSSASTNRVLNAASKPPLSSYNGGMRGSAQEKKRFFEQAIARQVQQLPQPIRHEPPKKYYASSGPPSESGTDISGYDSVSGDFFSLNNAYDRQTPISSNNENVYDCWYNSSESTRSNTKTPVSFVDNQSDFGHLSRTNSATPRAVEIIDDSRQSSKRLWESPTDIAAAIPAAADRNTNENGYFYTNNNNNQNMHDTSTDSGLASSVSLSTPPAPPPPPPSTQTAAAPQSPIKKWQVHVDEAPTKPITTIKTSVSTGKASGEVEVPRPQSVAELRAQIATKLEVRNPAGQRASPLSATEVNAAAPIIVHQPAQQHRGKLTPSISLLSLDRIQNGLDAMENGSNISPTASSPMTSTSNRQFYAEYSPSTSVPPFMGYDRSHTPNSLNETASDYSGGNSNNSTLRRQHSQLLSQPEVQHAVLLHPGYTDSHGRNNGLQTSFSMHDIRSNGNGYQNNNNNYSLLINNGQTAFNNQFPETNSSYEEAKQKYGSRPFSFYGNYNETATSYRDRSDTPTLISDIPTTKIRMNAGTPLLHHSRNENDDAAPITQQSHNHTSSNKNKQNNFSVSAPANIFEQKINLGNGGGEVTAQSKIDSPILKSPPFKDEERPLESSSALSSTPAQQLPTSQKSQSIEAASNRLAELIELAKKTFSDDTGRSINENNLWIKSDNHLKGEDKSSSSSPKNNYNLRRPHSVYELNKTDTMNNNNDNGYSTLPTRGKSATRSFRKSSITSNDPDDIVNAEKSAWYRSIYKQLHQVEPEGERTILRYQSGGDTPKMANLRPITPQARFEQSSEIIDPQQQQQRRAKSVGRYDPVADMEILDRWSQQRNQYIRDQQPQPLQPQPLQQESQSPLQNGHAPEIVESNNTNPLTKGINEMKKMTMEEVLQRQRAEKLSEELDDQRNRRHGYFPGASPALQNNVQRFDHFLHQQEIPTNNFDYSSSRCSTPSRRGYSQGPIQTCTVLYKFTAQNPRELSLNRGDVVRVNREIDSNWIEGERNGNVGIFPSSYVQMDEDPSTSRNRVRVLYPFQARNRNELSLKRGEILRRRREIDAHWFEGTNSKGQIGIFPKCYVQDYNEGVENGDDAAAAAGSVIPDRPKTPKIVSSTNYASRAQSPSPSKKANLDRSHQIQQHEKRRQNFSGPARMVPKNAETYRALYPYKPEHSDELELQENDIIFVVEKCDDGWFIGTCLSSGKFGTFPGNYVEKH